MVLEAVDARPGATRREEIRARLGADPRAARRDRADPAARRRDRPATRRRGGRRRSRAGIDPVNGGFGDRAEVPAGERARPAARPRAHRAGRADPRRDGRGRHPRPARRRLRPLLGRRAPGSSPTSRRCSTTTRCSPAPTCAAWQELGHERYREVCAGILDWTLREMRGPEGGFYSALDADSEGEEGRFYTWTPEEARAALEDAGLEHDEATRPARPPRDHRERGTSTGAASCTSPEASTPSRRPASTRREAALLAARAERVRPGLDDKRLCALERADGGRDGRGRRRARRASLRRRRGRLRRLPARDDARRATGACCAPTTTAALASTPTSRTTPTCSRRCSTSTRRRFDPRFYASAREIADAMIERFGDPENGGFFTTSDDHEELIARRKDLDDHPAPSGNSSAARGLLRLAALSGEARLRGAGAPASCGCSPSRPATIPRRSPTLLGAIDMYLVADARGRADRAEAEPAATARAGRACPRPATGRTWSLAGGEEGADRAGAAGRPPGARRRRRPPTSASASPARRRSAPPEELERAARRLRSVRPSACARSAGAATMPSSAWPASEHQRR